MQITNCWYFRVFSKKLYIFIVVLVFIRNFAAVK